MDESNKEDVLMRRLQSLRWKDGLRCPRCGDAGCWLHARGKGGRRKLRCGACGRTFNDLTGTPLARSHLPLSLWAAAARIMLAGRPTCSELSRKLRVKLATAWRVRRVLSRVVADEVLRQVLAGEDAP
jgi:transposase-like protein